MSAKRLAQNLLQLRKLRRLSQAGLANKTGIPRSTLAHLESGSGNPSLRNLEKLADALDVSIDELLARPRSSCALIKAADIEMRTKGFDAARQYKLLPDPIPGMEMDRLELEPGGKFAGVPHLAHTKEYLTCLTGVVRVAVAGEIFEVEQGDVLAFPGNAAHSYFNPGSVTASCISVVVFAPGG